VINDVTDDISYVSGMVYGLLNISDICILHTSV